MPSTNLSELVGHGGLTSGDFAQIASPLVGLLKGGEEIAVVSGHGPAEHAALLAAMKCGGRLALLPEADSAEATEIAASVGASWIAAHNGTDWRIAPVAAPNGSVLERPPLVLFTSGTSGIPKPVWHEWAQISSLATSVPPRLHGKRWASVYAPRSFAAIQVILAASISEGEVWYAPSAVADLPAFFEVARPDIVSATPSWWRRLILGWPSGRTKPTIQQATLGGEPITQDILDAVAANFRPGRLTHVYASSEAGSVFAVSDGRAGFPVEWLTPGPSCRLRIRDGQLEVKVPDLDRRGPSSRAGAVGDGWFRTPDAAEIAGDRVLIEGRTDTTINVGGVKVLPEQVESIARTFPGIADCRAFAKPNPITGAVVALEVVAEESVVTDPIPFRTYLGERLPRAAQPRQVKFVAEIALTSAGKRSRTEA